MNQSVLSPAGVQALSIHGLWLLMLTVCTVVFVCTLTAVFFAVIRGTGNRSKEESELPREQTIGRVVGSAVALTVVTLIACSSRASGRGDRSASLHASSAVTIAITGHQWWWEIEYEDAMPEPARRRPRTRLHIPTNRPVVLKVTSRDVIHSFWVPNLQGKRDLIPGYTTAIWLQADRPGVFRGQCAEFCGLQHAHMAHRRRRRVRRGLRRLARRHAAAGTRSAGDATERDAAVTSSCRPGVPDATRSAAPTPPARSLPT